MFLIAAGIINACLNMVLVIVFNLGVAGVAIATIFSQFISCVLVLRCLNKTDASYQLRFSKLKIKGYLNRYFRLEFRQEYRVQLLISQMLCCSRRLIHSVQQQWQDIQQPTIFLAFYMHQLIQ